MPGDVQGGPPSFFVNVASKGFSQTVSLLFATLAGQCINVASKELMVADAKRRAARLGGTNLKHNLEFLAGKAGDTR
jgi:hypothetical protein